jgi:hypothetical protein
LVYKQLVTFVFHTCSATTTVLYSNCMGSTASCSDIIFFFNSSGTIGHVAHGKSTVVKAISGVQV